MTHGYLIFTTLVGMLGLTTPVVAQTGTIRVIVVDRGSAQPINGARVQLDNTRFTGQTDGRGTLILQGVPPNDYTVRVLSIGYRSTTQPVTIALGDTASLQFALVLTMVSLDEIVVTGTGGAVEKKKLGVTVGAVDVEKVQDIVGVHDFGSVLRARIPGVQSFSTTGGVGDSKVLRIRGVQTLSTGLMKRPIVYIDGVRIDTDTFNGPWDGTACCFFSGGAGMDRLNDLNLDDIERIEVVKGAAAATLYGTEAVNGVIQIFTKRGRRGSSPRWTATYATGFHRLRANFDTKQHPRFTGPDGTRARDANDLIENGWIQRGNLTVQGGGELLTYFLSAGLNYEEGSLQPNDMLRGNVRLNLNWTASDSWHFDMRSAFTRNRTQLLQSGNNWTALLGNAILGNPLNASAERPYGEPFTAIEDIRQVQSETFANRWTGGLTLNFSPDPSFGHRVTLGLDQVTDRRERLHPFGGSYIYVGTDGERSVGYRNFSLWTMDYLGTWSVDLGSNVQSDFSFGVQGLWETDRTNTAIGEGYAGVGVTTVTGAAIRSGHESFREEINVGLFAQDRFSVSNKLFLTVGARMDGNSAFGDNFGLQFYPKAEVAYLLAEDGLGTISSLKLRGAVGLSGQAPGPFDRFRTFAPFTVLEGETGVRLLNPGNQGLEPEKTTEFEAGVDVGFFSNRLSIEATGYHAKTTDALVPVPLAPSLGFEESQLQNIGALENTGWEVKLDAAIIQGDWFRWSAGLNVDGNRNRVTDLGPSATCNADRTECKINNETRLGFPVGALFYREITGFDASTGRHIRSDTTVFRGQPLPDWSGTMTQALEFGAVRVYGMFTWEQGASFFGDRHGRIIQGSSDELLRFVQDDGTYTFAADSLVDFVVSAPPVAKRDHIRLQEVSIAYRMPANLISKLGLGRTIATLSAQNLMWWDDCYCFDPSARHRGGSNPSSRALLATPQPRTFVFSLRTSF